MWNKLCIFDVIFFFFILDILLDYNLGMNLSYFFFFECILCVVVCMLISRFFNVIYL